MWLTAPKGTTAFKQTSATYWHMDVRRNNVISITLRQVDFPNYISYLHKTIWILKYYTSGKYNFFPEMV